MNELIMALAMLSTPVTEDTIPFNSFTVACYQGILREQCINDEILDRSAQDNWLRLQMKTFYVYDDKGTVTEEQRPNWDELVSDLDFMRKCYVELGDAPHTAEHYRFPPLKCCNEMLEIDYAYGQYLDKLLESGYRADEFRVRAAKVETERLQRIWYLLARIQLEYVDILSKRSSLKELHEQLGDDDYYNGVVPPIVPFWRYETIKKVIRDE